MAGTVVSQRETPAQRRWRFPWAQSVACLVILAGVLVTLYPQIASWFSQREQSRVIELMRERMDQPPQNDPVLVNSELELARAYNEALASGAIYEANTNVATGEGTFADGGFDYEELLALTGGGFMGRLRYDDLTIDLPIYHGTSDTTLEKGVGHLEGTSLPVGGVGTRSVLTAHRGLPESTLFNDLDKAEEGDTFSVLVLDEVLTYRVVSVQVIEPDQTEAIFADPERDLITLVTCTPLGINSHRILVTGERVTPTPIIDVETAFDAPEIPGFPWWAIILSGTVIVLVAYIWRSGYGRATKPISAPSPQ